VPDYGFDQGLWLAIFLLIINSGNNAVLLEIIVIIRSSILLNLVVTGLIILEVLVIKLFWRCTYGCMIACCENPSELYFLELPPTPVTFIAGKGFFFYEM